MSQALLFLVDTALSLLLYVFLLRLMLHWARGNFRNPFAQALLKFSNWLVIPLRRILPALGRVDTASLVGAYAVTLIKIAAFNLIMFAQIPPAIGWLSAAGIELLRSLLWIYFWSIFVYALISMIAPGIRSPLADLLESICEPVLQRIRSAVPPIGGLDLSPMWAGIVIQVLLILLR
ncbi:MAG: YggT family protein [Steroidobacteraceae bacterium]|jgi:YggT family protein